ncbi:hypothetical protein [Saccharothrix hoggarensis]|uniref:Tetratricopeptide repeat protein n=1 Tax=Saccharothrix hoggarensis TaxID=913853 RepID=A0ABW3QG09_9PSEU
MGASTVNLAPALATARALAGDLDGALRAVDAAARTEEGFFVAASVLARRGELARAADVLAGARYPQARHVAAIALTTTGSWRTAALRRVPRAALTRITRSSPVDQQAA